MKYSLHSDFRIRVVSGYLDFSQRVLRLELWGGWCEGVATNFKEYRGAEFFKEGDKIF